ncbi:unnamed protein product, partial [Cladocopium goreaui]
AFGPHGVLSSVVGHVLISDFVEAVPAMRVFPTEDELRSFWRRCISLEKAGSESFGSGGEPRKQQMLFDKELFCGIACEIAGCFEKSSRKQSQRFMASAGAFLAAVAVTEVSGGRPPGVPSLDSERFIMLQARILRVILSAFGQEWLGRHTLPLGGLLAFTEPSACTTNSTSTSVKSAAPVQRAKQLGYPTKQPQAQESQPAKSKESKESKESTGTFGGIDDSEFCGVDLVWQPSPERFQLGVDEDERGNQDLERMYSFVRPARATAPIPYIPPTAQVTLPRARDPFDFVSDEVRQMQGPKRSPAFSPQDVAGISPRHSESPESEWERNRCRLGFGTPNPVLAGPCGGQKVELSC